MAWSEWRLVVGLAVVMAYAAIPARARTNGMPTEIEPVELRPGGLVPLEGTNIALVSERLTIKPLFPNPIGGFSVRAVYTLRNPGPARRIAYGVPVYWPMTEAGWDIYDGLTAEAFEKVQIRLDGRRIRCQKRASKDPYSYSGYSGWCVASMVIPHGDSIPLELEYPAERASGIEYPLWPAGFWKGPVERLSIRVELGRAASSAMVASPPGGSIDANGVLAWEFENVDLKQLGAIQVRFAPTETRYGGWIRESADLSAAASSTLPPEGKFAFGPEKALDGDEKTAWCEGAPGDGEGEWLRVTLKAPARPGWECKIIDFTMLPGYSRDDASYLANGRVTKARIESCADPKKGLDLSLIGKDQFIPNDDTNVASDWLLEKRGSSPVWIHLPADALGGERECVRLLIRGAKPGAKFHDTCISEFTPRLYCKKLAAEESVGPGLPTRSP